ncbi:MAG: hypothetical protein O2856_02270 [Planctomycetota bacterium]|nr:hypothetical protein [Planctomycetota bacterium]
MNNAEPTLIDRRRRVGWMAILCLSVAVFGLATTEHDTVWAAGAMRIGIVLGALWLCFPSKTRPAAWAALTQGRLTAIVIGAFFMNRLKYALPFVAIAATVIWFIRPRGKKPQG